MLVQDEPTSHLDMQSIEALQTCLNSYTGGIVLVTHDQHFCNGVAEKVPLNPPALQDGVWPFALHHCPWPRGVQSCSHYACYICSLRSQTFYL